MLARQVSGRPGIGAGSAGFSANWTTRRFSSIPITPNARPSSKLTGRHPTVAAAPAARWSAIRAA